MGRDLRESVESAARMASWSSCREGADT